MSDSADSASTPEPFQPYLPPAPAYTPPPAVAGLAPPAALITVRQPDRPKRTAMWLAIAVVLVVALGVGGWLLMKKDDAAKGFSLRAAATNAQKVTDITYEMQMKVGGLLSMNAQARTDSERKLMDMSMTMSMSGEDDVTFGMLMDLGNKVVYVKQGSLLLDGVDVPTAWASIDISEMPSLNASLNGLGDDPLAVAPAFVAPKQSEDLGRDTVNGIEVEHYRVTIATKDALAANPGLQTQLDSLGTAIPDELVYDVYVDADNIMRRLTYELTIAGQTITTDMVVKAIGGTTPIQVPAPADVTDVSDQVKLG